MAYTTFEGRIVETTGAAFLFHGVYWEQPMWMPFSQALIEEDNPDTGHVVVRLKDWLAGKKRLLEFTHYSALEIEEMNAR